MVIYTTIHILKIYNENDITLTKGHKDQGIPLEVLTHKSQQFAEQT